MKKYVITKLANSDLAEIRDYIAAENKEAAKRVLNEIRKAIRMIVQNPEIGHKREELSQEAKFLLIRSYLIAYLPKSPIIILRVLHGARDISSLL